MNTLRLDRFSFKKLSRHPVGHHILDSGDVYGRNYERKLATQLSVDVEYNEYHDEFWVSASIPLGAWLDERLELDAKATKLLRSFKGERLNSRDAAEEYAKRTNQLDAFERGSWNNTYNYKTDLDQVVQWYQFRDVDGNEIYFVETHNGCDVRGGYSQVVVARATSLDDESALYDYRVRWMVDCAYSSGKVKDQELLRKYQCNDGDESLDYIVGSVETGAKIQAATKIGPATVHLILSNGHELTVSSATP